MGPKRVSKRNSDVEQPSNFDKKVKDLENFEKGLRKVKKTAHPKLPKYRKRHGVHDMTSVPRGRCLIIANYIFKKKNEVDRKLGLPGYVRDSEILAKVFEQLNFVVKSEENLTVDEMKTLLHEESHADLEGGLTPNAFVAVILSHGNESGICGVDFYNTDSNTNGHTENPQNELINSNNSDAPNDVSPSPSTSAITSSGQMSRKKMLTEKDIIEVLNNQNCKSLQDRPKLIFIQACNGDEVDKGVRMGKGSRRTRVESNLFPEGKAANTGFDFFNAIYAMEDVDGNSEKSDRSVSPLRLIPTVSELMICYSTISGYQSQVLQNGSTFGVSLAWALMNNAHDTDLQSLLNLISADMKEACTRSSHGDPVKQIPEVRFKGWTKKLFFNPGYPKPPKINSKPREKKSTKTVPEILPSVSVVPPGGTITDGSSSAIENDPTQMEQPSTSTAVKDRKNKSSRKRKNEDKSEDKTVKVPRPANKRKPKQKTPLKGQRKILEFLTPSPRIAAENLSNTTPLSPAVSGQNIMSNGRPAVQQIASAAVEKAKRNLSSQIDKGDKNKKGEMRQKDNREMKARQSKKDRTVSPLNAQGSQKVSRNENKNLDLSRFKKGPVDVLRLGSKNRKQ